MNITFDDFNLNKQLLEAIKDLQFETPTEIQQKAIPQIMAGHDILGIAQTGTGKSAAFLLPLLMKVKYAQGTNPRALILAPTRELAMQLFEHLQMLGKNLDLRYAVAYGGVGPKTQIAEIKKGLDILVATPGRLIDLYLTGELILKDIKTLILDEADKMMDMGFMPQIRKILEVVPNKRQNLLFSATMHDKVVSLSDEFLEFPMRIEVSPQSSAAKTVSQLLYQVPNFKTKINLLQHLIRDTQADDKILIFVKSKAHADNIYKFIERKINKSIRIVHGNKGQNTRINAVNDFKEGKVQLLVATDVASRGLDISMVSLVVNFDVPVIYEDYVHRIGRTGRAGNTGEAITFSTPADIYHIEKIEKIIRTTIPKSSIPKEVKIEPTPFEEKQKMDMEIDALRKKSDPNFKGAFHEKKNPKPAFKKTKNLKNQTNKSKSKGQKNPSSEKKKPMTTRGKKRD
ncbi:MAG: DEAD/DEAH box helicase [Cytophagales bacterium]|nr:MAG: DEAD/DEAH box helicase [Cytophagales bacterium]